MLPEKSIARYDASKLDVTGGWRYGNDGNIEERILGGDKAAIFQWKSKRKGGNCG